MIIAITNQKGGVGKTTTVLNIGVYIALAGKKVLLVDIDPQSNLTSGLGITHELTTIKETDNKKFLAARQAGKTIYDVLINKAKTSSAIQKTRIENLDILPSGIELAGAEIELVGALSRETILRKALESIEKEYDYILIDCPPSLSLLTINSLVASNQVLIPVQSEYFALEGLGQLINTIKLVKGSLNPALEIGGVILTMFDNRTNLSKDVAKELTKFFGDKLFSSVVPRNIKLSEAPSRGLSIHEYSPESAGSIAYKKLSDEILERFDKEKVVLIRPKLTKVS